MKGRMKSHLFLLVLQLISSLSIILHPPPPTYPPARITVLIRWVISPSSHFADSEELSPPPPACRPSFPSFFFQNMPPTTMRPEFMHMPAWTGCKINAPACNTNRRGRRTTYEAAAAERAFQRTCRLRRLRVSSSHPRKHTRCPLAWSFISWREISLDQKS